MKAPHHTLFQSFVMAGFESSCHRRKDRRRLDVLCSTRHDELAESDYRALQSLGISTVRDGLRWHLIERAPRQYDWSSFIPMLHAARRTGTEVIWDLCHYGWPDDIDVFQPEFVDRFRAFAGSFARLMRDEGAAAPFVCPVNEINFLAWNGGEVGHINPWEKTRADDLKRQLVRAAIAATEAVLDVLPAARIAHCEPAIHIFPRNPAEGPAVAAYVEAQYQAWDMIGGYLWPELGGKPEYLDLIGVNFYPINEWLHHGRPVFPGDPLYKPFSEILGKIHERYNRPVFVAETGIEGEKRVEWMSFISDEVRTALSSGVPVQGLCWYPILDYPGWDDDRHCSNGVLSYADAAGHRKWDAGLRDEILRQQALFEPLMHPQLAAQTG